LPVIRRPSPALRLALAGATAQGAAVGVGRFVYTPILPTMMSDLGLNASQAGWIASANFLGYLFGALLATHAHFRRAPRLWLLAALALSATTTAGMGLTTSMALFMGLRAVGGIASAFVIVFASVVVLARLSAAGRGGLSAVHFAGVGTFIALSALLTAAMTGAGLHWRAEWLASGALSALAILAVLALLPADQEAAAETTPIDAAAPEREGAGSLMLAYGLFGFGYVVTATFIVAIVKTYPAAHPVEPFVWLLVGLSAIPSVALWTLAGERIGMRRAFAVACVVEAVGVAVSVLSPTAAGAAAAAILLGGTYMGITALGLVAARQADPLNAPRILGRMTAAFALGQMIGPAFAGWLAERLGGFGSASLIASGALLLSAALTFRRIR
jgi:predicted MFS family arabinose efflux permease